MKRIFLKNIRQYALVDEEDYEYLSRYCWYGYKSSHDKHYYVRATINIRPGVVRTIQLHRTVVGAEPEESITFKNRNRLDCRKGNLVVASRSAIRQHGDRWDKCAREYRGVYFQHDKYGAQLRVNGKTHYLGQFDTAIEAAKAYDKSAIAHFPKELVSLNFPKAA